MHRFVPGKGTKLSLIIFTALVSLLVPLLQAAPAGAACSAYPDCFTWITGQQIKHDNGGETFNEIYVTDSNAFSIDWEGHNIFNLDNIANPTMLLMSTTVPGCQGTSQAVVRDSGGSPLKTFPATGSLVVVENFKSAGSVEFASMDPSCQVNDFAQKGLTNFWQDFGAQWLDPIHIQYFGATGQNGVYTESGYNTGIMTLDGPTNGCGTSQISVGTDPTSSYQAATTATLSAKIQTSPSGQPLQCNNSTVTLALINKHTDVAITAQWPADTPNIQDPTTATIDITKSTYDLLGAPNGFTTAINDTSFSGQSIDSSNTFTLAGSTGVQCGGKTDQMVIANYQTSITATITQYANYNGQCRIFTIPFVDLLNTFGNPTNPGGGGNPPSGDTCPVDAGDGTRWVTCPVLNILDSAAIKINGFIGLFLVFPVDQFFSGGTQHVFTVFRNLGVALLVIAGLVMVISQAADLDIFSAYTVRKALPRIIIAAIGISLAWPLLQYVITFFNDLGNWIGNIIIDVAASSQGGGAGFGGFALDGLATLIAGIATVAWLGSFTIGGILALLASIILFLLLGLFVLLLRQIVILICILAAPLAIAAYILPGTEKLWRYWKDTLLTTLLMFPIIMAFLSAGAAMGHITGTVSSNPLFSVLSLFFYIVPYAMIPFAFKLAGGVMSQLYSLAEGQHHKSIESRLAGYRANEQKWKKQELLEGRRKPAFGKLGSSVVDLQRRISTPGGVGMGRREWLAARQNMTNKTAAKAVQEGTEIAGNDDVTAAILSPEVTNDRSFREFLKNKRGWTDDDKINMELARVKLHFGQLGQSNTLASAFIARNASNKGYDPGTAGMLEREFDLNRLVKMGVISETAGIGAMRANQNRPDAVGSWGAQFALQGKVREIMDTQGITSLADLQSNADAVEATNAFFNDAVNGMQLGRLASAHPWASESLAPILTQRVQSTTNALNKALADPKVGNDEIVNLLRDYVNHSADFRSVLDYLGTASPEVARRVQELYSSQAKDVNVNLNALNARIATGLNNADVRQVANLLEDATNHALDGVSSRTVNEVGEALRGSRWTQQRRNEFDTARAQAATDQIVAANALNNSPGVLRTP